MHTVIPFLFAVKKILDVAFAPKYLLLFYHKILVQQGLIECVHVQLLE